MQTAILRLEIRELVLLCVVRRTKQYCVQPLRSRKPLIIITKRAADHSSSNSRPITNLCTWRWKRQLGAQVFASTAVSVPQIAIIP